MLIQYLHHHSSEKLILSVQASNWAVLLQPARTSLLGDQYSSPFHKPCGYTVGITLQNTPHGPPEKFCGLAEELPPIATYSVSSRGLLAVKPFDHCPPDAFVNRFHIMRNQSFRLVVASLYKCWIKGKTSPLLHQSRPPKSGKCHLPMGAECHLSSP